MPTAAAVPVDIPIDRGSGTPLYLQLAASIERAIAEGTLSPGDRLENEVDLSRRLGLSRPTVRQGIQEVVDKGMLVRRRGVGTQVVQSKVKRPVALTSLFDDLERAGQHPTTDLVEYRIGRPDAEAAERLNVSMDTQILEITRVRRAGGEPLALLHNVLPARIAPTPEELLTMGLYESLRKRNVRVAVASERIGAIAADRAVADLLDEEVGAPMLTMERTSHSNNGDAIEYGNHVYRASRYSFEVTLVE
jgi:DNA-binding GntR family transcriptional regulator